MNLEISLRRLQGHEGKYANHPDDPGGETMWGITKRVARAHGYTGEMRDLTWGQATEIYRKAYWVKAQIEHLPPGMRFQVFDAAVNHGVGNAVRFLQRAAGVADDGIVGPVTRRAINNHDVWNLILNFNAERLEFYTKLSTFNTFGRGWTRRVAQNLKYGAEDI